MFKVEDAGGRIRTFVSNDVKESVFKSGQLFESNFLLGCCRHAESWRLDH